MFKKLLVLVLVMTNTSFVSAYMTPTDYPTMMCDIYVDATVDNLWPTDDVNYTSVSDWAYDATTSSSVIYNKWYIKGGTVNSLSTAALYGTAFQGCGTSLPQLTMITGDVLDTAKTYNVYAVYWARNDTEYWHTFAGLDSEPLWLCNNITEYENIFSTGTFVVDGCQLFLGQVSGVSSVTVNVDGPNINDAAKRAWFDGLAFVETTPGPYVTLTMSANITDPENFAVNPLEASVVNIYPSVGQHSIVQGKRVQIKANQSSNCPDIYEFSGFTGDVTGTVGTSQLKIVQNMSITANYQVLVYTPKCGGDICHPFFRGDTNDDCRVDVIDLANMVSNWLECTKPECD